MRSFACFWAAGFLSLACGAIACGGGDAVDGATTTAPTSPADLDGGASTTDDDGGSSGEPTKDASTKDGATTKPDAAVADGWTTLLASSWQLTKDLGCDPNVSLRGLAIDPAQPDHFVTTQECRKGFGTSATTSTIVLDVAPSGVNRKELPQSTDRMLGVTMTAAGRAILAMTSAALSTTPSVMLHYHDPGAPSWLSATRGYSAFDGAPRTMATGGGKILLSDKRIYDVSASSDTTQWFTRSNDIVTNVAGGISAAWVAIDPADPTKVLFATSFPLTVYSCTLPAAGPGNATCDAKPADQGLGGITYQAWNTLFPHAGTIDTLWATAGSPAKFLVSTDRGLTFTELALPAPCAPAATVSAFAGDPKDPKTFVIMQYGAGSTQRLFATRDGGLTYVEVPGFKDLSGSSELAIDGTGALVVASYGRVMRRTSF